MHSAWPGEGGGRNNDSHLQKNHPSIPAPGSGEMRWRKNKNARQGFAWKGF